MLSTDPHLQPKKTIDYTETRYQQPVRIEYYDSGSGPCICILPSLARSGRDYDEVAVLLNAQGFRVIRPNPRGTGNSTGPLERLDMHDFAADVAAVLDHAGIRTCVVVGHAWGSQPARMLAVDRPDLVTALVMAAASAGKLPAGSMEQPFTRLRDAIDGSSDMTLSDAERTNCLRRAFFAPGHDPRVWLTGWSTAAHEAQSYARNHTDVDVYFSAGDTVPILDLQAEFDAVVIAGVMKPLLGERVTEQTIRNAGHAMAPEQPQAMADAIGAFAAQHISQ